MYKEFRFAYNMKFEWGLMIKRIKEVTRNKKKSCFI